MSEKAVSSMVAAATDFPGILEIGPGPGVLTSPLSEIAERMIVLELDSRMPLLLAESAPKADVRQQDALKADLAATLSELPEPRVLVSNLPYYITGPLLQRFAEVRTHYSRAILMMQKEVATRVMAPPKHSDRGSLSVYLQSQFKISLVCHVPAGGFLPPPKVDSTVLQFEPRDMGIGPEQEAKFQRLVRFAFAQPRKTLVNNLAGGYHIGREASLEWVERAGLTEKSRPQEISEADFVRLVDTMA